MTEKLAAHLVGIAVSNGIVKDDNADLYIYSYQIMIERILTWTSILLISLIFGTLPYTLIFICFFGFLRMFTGGWHASNFQVCFLSSVGIFLGFSFIEPFITEMLSENVMMSIIVGCGLLIGLLGPIADPNKPMNAKEFRRCRIISILILFIELIISFTLLVMKIKQPLVFILFSFVILSITLMFAHCKQFCSPSIGQNCLNQLMR